jgi:[protein-PII] uridylyltransferase
MQLTQENYAKLWRENLKQNQALLRDDFFKHKNTRKLLKQQSKLVDNLLRQIWLQFDLSDSACLVAVGGYGRGELFPYSDVDLLILLPNSPDTSLNERIERVVGLFWDIGLAVGHSVRNLDECITEAKKDVTVQTNLLESRLIIGNPPLIFNLSSKNVGGNGCWRVFQSKTS